MEKWKRAEQLKRQRSEWLGTDGQVIWINWNWKEFRKKKYNKIKNWGFLMSQQTCKGTELKWYTTNFETQFLVLAGRSYKNHIKYN